MKHLETSLTLQFMPTRIFAIIIKEMEENCFVY